MKSEFVLTHFCKHFNSLWINHLGDILELQPYTFIRTCTYVSYTRHKYLQVADFYKKKKQTRIMNIIHREFKKINCSLYHRWLNAINCSQFSFEISTDSSPSSGVFYIDVCFRDPRSADTIPDDLLFFCLQKRFVEFTMPFLYTKEKNKLLNDIIERHYANVCDLKDNLGIDTTHSYWMRKTHRKKIHWVVIHDFFPDDIEYFPTSYNNKLSISGKLLLKSITTHYRKERLYRLKIEPYLENWRESLWVPGGYFCIKGYEDMQKDFSMKENSNCIESH